MNANANDLIQRNSVFVWIAFATGVLLLIPLIAMQFTEEVKWGVLDFIIMGLLLFGTASAGTIVARKLSRKRRFWVGVIVVASLLLVWAELAVGVFTNLGD